MSLPGAARLSIRRNFAWNLGGLALFNLSQWIVILILARLTDREVVGTYALSLAIAAPVFLTLGMNPTTLMATDARRGWRMREYRSLRIVLNTLAVLVTMAIGYFGGAQLATLFVLAAVCWSKSVESVSRTYYGLFQQNERLDLVSRSLILRSVLGPLGFFAGVLIGDELVWGCVGLAVGWLVCVVLHDRPAAVGLARAVDISLGQGQRTDWRAVRSLAFVGAPLGVDAGISSLAINVPRYAIHAILGATSLGVYSALAALAQTVQMISSSLSGAMIARLATYHYQGRKRAFLRLLWILTGVGVGVVLVSMLGALVLGGPFLRLTLGKEYDHVGLLVALMASMGVVTLQRSLCKSIEASRRFKTYVVVDSITTGAVALLATPCVLEWGLVGAAVALAGGFAVGVVAVGVVLTSLTRQMDRDRA